MKHQTDQLFSISQAAKSCNLSRSTLLRLEERGLLTPAYILPDSGRRYYDNHNISRILQIQRLQSMGFTTEETASYFAEQGEAKKFLTIIEEKISALEESREEMLLRTHSIPHMSIQMIRLPEMLCCVREYTGFSIEDRYNAMYEFFHDCVAKGYVLSSEPLFLINHRTDYLEGHLQDVPFQFQVCVPVLPSKAPGDAVLFPSCSAVSLLYHGSYQNIEKAYLCLGEEVKKRKLTPAGFLRAIGVVAPYVGREIKPDSYCTRLVLPVEDTPGE